MALHFEQAARHLSALSPIDASPIMRGRMVSGGGLRIAAKGLHAPIGQMVRIIAPDGAVRLAEIAGYEADIAQLIPFEDMAGVAPGAVIEIVGAAGQIAIGPEYLGRVIDAMGEPLDGKGAIAATSHAPLRSAAGNVLDRAPVTQPLDTGVRAINALLPAGRGQRVALIAGSGVGKSSLMRQILSGTDAEIVVLGLIGERAREVSELVEHVTRSGALCRMVVVAVSADRAPLLRIKAVERACAIAEYFRGQGKSVLLFIDSLTRVAHAQREIGLAMGEPPTMKGYPPSAIALIPQIVERAGNDRVSGGSITAFYTILADGDDLDDPIVDATRAITDGHIILDRHLADQGVYPAIDAGRSISRVADALVDRDQAVAMRHFRKLWSSYSEKRDLVLMGAYQAGSDPVLDEALARRADQLAFLTQDMAENIDLDASRDTLVTEFGQ
ncbi:MAG: FliI/YscN family ATPase [Parasphingorhabdus sp.]|nr:FliI/YscN family ATPase [Parasphingorhabdus sp.]